MKTRTLHPVPSSAPAVIRASGKAVPPEGVGLSVQDWGKDPHEQTAAGLAFGSLARLLMANHKARKGALK